MKCVNPPYGWSAGNRLCSAWEWLVYKNWTRFRCLWTTVIFKSQDFVLLIRLNQSMHDHLNPMPKGRRTSKPRRRAATVKEVCCQRCWGGVLLQGPAAGAMPAERYHVVVIQSRSSTGQCQWLLLRNLLYQQCCSKWDVSFSWGDKALFCLFCSEDYSLQHYKTR